MRGPKEYIAIALARSLSAKRSPTLPAPKAIGAAPERPARKRR